MRPIYRSEREMTYAHGMINIAKLSYDNDDAMTDGIKLVKDDGFCLRKKKGGSEVGVFAEWTERELSLGKVYRTSLF